MAVEWPPAWKNAEGKLHCPARECNYIFSEQSFSHRKVHWTNNAGHQPPKIPTTTDHQILCRMNCQDRCTKPGCNQEGFLGLKYCVDHEFTVHGTQNMSTIPGFVRLTRLGLAGEPGKQAQKFIFDRMCQLLNGRPELIKLFHRGSFLPLYQNTVSELVIILSPAFKRPGGADAPYWTAVPPVDFLMHLQPTAGDPDDGSGWAQTWLNLRAWYASGEI